MWLKAGMLVPGETVNVYVGPGEESTLLTAAPGGVASISGRTMTAHC